MHINKDMTILELLRSIPMAADILEKHGLRCSDCMAMTKESIEEGARRHGIDINILMDDLNNLFKQ